MLQNKRTGEKNTENRGELAERYFGGFVAYSKGNMGIVSLLSDTQELIQINILKHTKGAEMYKKEAFGTCVSNPFDTFEELEVVIDDAIEITMEEFLEECNVDCITFSNMQEYPNDYQFYRTGSIYFFKWSAIETFFRP